MESNFSQQLDSLIFDAELLLHFESVITPCPSIEDYLQMMCDDKRLPHHQQVARNRFQIPGYFQYALSGGERGGLGPKCQVIDVCFMPLKGEQTGTLTLLIDIDETGVPHINKQDLSDQLWTKKQEIERGLLS